VRWLEDSGDVLGAPFFVMDAVVGQPVSDLPPYVFGSWVTEASASQQETMRTGAVAVLAGIHSVTALSHDLDSLELDVPGESALVRHVANQRRYYDWIRGDQHFPVIEAAFRWLDEHWPAATGPDCLSWGDARAANILWRDFQPVAVLDWEAAAVAPPEVDLGWFIWFHEYFQRVAVRHGHAGAPALFPRHQMLTEYGRLTGVMPASMGWFLVYAELRQALTSIRVSSRAVHFGERPPPSNPEDLLHEPAHLREVVAGAIAI
jgi:aminoglycoside phosphotransferase (APT) family kinase protein